MAAPVDHRLAGTALVVDRALRTIETGAHRLRQRLLSRRLARSLSPDEWTPTASDEVGLTAEDLRRRSEEIRSASQG
jgi:hypothetical protein